MEMAVKSMEMAVEVMESMEMAPGALPHPGKVPKQRLLSPKIGLRRRRRYRTSSGNTPIDLGFSIGRLYTSGEAASEGTWVAHTIAWHGLGSTHAMAWCGQTLAPLRLSFGFHLMSGKIGTLDFVSSNFKNITCVAFLKHKNSRKQGTVTVASH
jgi:hypothetical protein